MNNFNRDCEKIAETLQVVGTKGNFQDQTRKPKLSDIELIAIDLLSEFMDMDLERDLFRKQLCKLVSRIERSVNNHSKRRLFYYQSQLRKQIASQIVISDYYIFDSMSLEICNLSRSSSCSICKEAYQRAPNKGYCALESTNYYGYKLYAACTIESVFTDFDLSQTSIPEIHYLKDIKQISRICTIIGDKGYLSVDPKLSHSLLYNL